MKTWMLLAVMALAPMAVSAAAPANEGVRADLIKEIEAARTALLPQTEPLAQVTVRFQPRLNDVKASAVAAKTPVQLQKAKKDFGDWKTVVLRHLYGENSGLAAGESYEKFSAGKATEINFVMAMRQQFAAQRVEASVSAVRAASLKPDASWSGVFDNSAAAPGSFAALSGPDGAVRAEAPLPASDPARYDKIRSLLLSQGVSPKIIDTAIAEGRRQKVDPMIVLSVISQESNFRKNAYNRGSGCTGLMQLDPNTAADMGVRGSLYDAGTNIKAGVKYLNWIANSFFKMNLDMSDLSKVPAEKLKMVLASYNWGIGNVQRLVNKYGTEALDRVAPRETRNYIAEIPSRIYNWFASF
ncbi:MAG: transglycosylase SLT domain-containing protein [Elusimicrobia bacterium]|nr:transglycosylase SLT domain-containing protein [Elusimicrobiota bacterium]